MKEFEIRKAQEQDIAVCALIEQKSFSEPWSEKSLTDALYDADMLFYVLCIDDEAIGYYVAGNICGEINLYTIAVATDKKGRGYGQVLLAHLINIAKANSAYFIGLEVRVSNVVAISLYEKNGFIRSGKRPDFYKKPNEDAYLYTLFFNNEG